MFFNPLSGLGGVILFLSLLSGSQGDSLILLWTSMELNLIGFILVSFSGYSPGHFLFKYFIVQSVGSALLLLGTLLSNLWEFTSSGMLVLCALLLKVGAAPLHHWFISLSELSPWGILIILSFPQKILPLLGLLVFSPNLGEWVYLAIVVGLWGSLSCNTIKTLLGYSSVFGLGWIFSGYSAVWVWVSFLFIYTLGMIMFLSPFYSYGSETAGAPGTQPSNVLMGSTSLMGGLSMAGFPPMPGFFMKLKIGLTCLLVVESSLFLLGLVMGSVFFLGMYLSVTGVYLTDQASGWLFASALGKVWLSIPLVISGAIIMWWLRVGVTHKKFWISST